MTQEKIRVKIELLPQNPGVYQFLNADEKVILRRQSERFKKKGIFLLYT